MRPCGAAGVEVRSSEEGQGLVALVPRTGVAGHLGERRGCEGRRARGGEGVWRRAERRGRAPVRRACGGGYGVAALACRVRGRLADWARARGCEGGRRRSGRVHGTGGAMAGGWDDRVRAERERVIYLGF